MDSPASNDALAYISAQIAILRAQLNVTAGGFDRKHVSAFFGGYAPFDRKAVETRFEDNQWLRDSWLEKQVGFVGDLARLILSHIEQVEFVYQSKSGLRFRSLETSPESGRIGVFSVTQRTEGSAPITRAIERWVVKTD
jgi:hypothetical protein